MFIIKQNTPRRSQIRLNDRDKINIGSKMEFNPISSIFIRKVAL